MVDDEMTEVWACALREFLEHGWQPIADFVDANSTLFGAEDENGLVGEFGEGEFECFQAYQRLAAQTTDQVLKDVGCNSARDEARFCAWLSKHANANGVGPREATARAVLRDVIAVVDFEAFVRMMRQRSRDLESEDVDATHPNKSHVDALKDALARRNAEPKECPNSPNRRTSWAKHSLFSPTDTTPTARRARRRADAAADGEASDDDEPLSDRWALQKATAMSLLASHEAGKLPQAEAPYVAWAAALVASSSDGGAEEAVERLLSSDPDGAESVHRGLLEHKFAISLAVAQRTAFSERADRADKAKQTASSSGGGDDARVDAALARCDELQRAAAVSRGACVRERAVRDGNLERGYLTVKSLLQSRVDLTLHASTIYAALYDVEDNGRSNAPGEPSAGSTLPLDMVRWCALEAELGTVQRRIESLLGDASTGRGSGVASTPQGYPLSPVAYKRKCAGAPIWHELLDLTTHFLYYVNAETGASQWEQPDEAFLPLDPSVLDAVRQDDAFGAEAESKPQAESKHGVKTDEIEKPGAFNHLFDLSVDTAGAQSVEAAPPPQGLPAALPTWGRRLSPLPTLRPLDGAAVPGMPALSNLSTLPSLPAMPARKTVFGQPHPWAEAKEPEAKEPEADSGAPETKPD
ncbi:hypothetical protein M885DRAFT_520870 [Pelagophyceae sp. CCMP2097]|nr:hypothetical protein M885DRAFT_520870 [Pelagophyceae sp. CCMP2097]